MQLGDLDRLKTAIDTIKQTGYDTNNEPLFEYVELPDLIKAIDASTVKIDTNDIEYKAYSKGLEDGKKIARRPQGRWIRYRDNPHQPEHIKCSNCGQYWSVADHDKIFDICFKCGAYMRGEQNES